jgi:uncharacterized protein YhaN
MKYLILLLCFASQSLFSQSDSADWSRTINKNTHANKMQNQIIVEFQNILEAHSERIDTCTNIADVNTANIEIISDSLHIRILDAHSNAHHAHSKIDAIDGFLQQNQNYWIMGSIIFFLVLGLFYFLFNKKIISIKQYSKGRRMAIENSLKLESVRLEQQLVNSNKEIAATNKKISNSGVLIKKSAKELTATKAELDATKAALEALTNQMNDLKDQLNTLKK